MKQDSLDQKVSEAEMAIVSFLMTQKDKTAVKLGHDTLACLGILKAGSYLLEEIIDQLEKPRYFMDVAMGDKAYHTKEGLAFAFEEYIMKLKLLGTLTRNQVANTLFGSYKLDEKTGKEKASIPYDKLKAAHPEIAKALPSDDDPIFLIVNAIRNLAGHKHINDKIKIKDGKSEQDVRYAIYGDSASLYRLSLDELFGAYNRKDPKKNQYTYSAGKSRTPLKYGIEFGDMYDFVNEKFGQKSEKGRRAIFFVWNGSQMPLKEFVGMLSNYYLNSMTRVYSELAKTQPAK
jgi:hypothetical protein